jgi:uncharacterized protein
MALDPLLIEVLACPVDKGPLWWFADEDFLYNPRLQRGYRVRDGLPVMLVDESVETDDAEHQRLVAKAAADAVTETGHGPSRGQAGGPTTP